MYTIESASDFDDQVKTHTHVIVDCTATWCGPCKRLKPKLVELESESPKIHFCLLDVDEVEEIATRENIECMPTILFFAHGKRQDSLTVTGADFAAVRKNSQELLKL